MKISVCIASYNGRRFIAAQIESILTQLNANDEVLVNDDGSNDGTVEYLRGLGDPRIDVVINPKRLGHTRNFEAVASRAVGDILMFSDQDDRWRDDKVSVLRALFEQHADVTLVHHALRMVDAEGQPIGRTLSPRSTGRQSGSAFLARQLWRGQLYGCAIAMRRSATRFCLPFPQTIYAHDHWLAIVHAICGRVYLSDAELIDYRQHGSNLTPVSPAPFMKQLSWRAQSLGQVAVAAGRRFS